MNNKIKKNISNGVVKVMVFGTFDGVHPGHLNFFKQAEKYGDRLVVVVARDINVKKIKGRRPIRKEKQRLSEVNQLIKHHHRDEPAARLNQAILGGLKDPYAVIKKIKPEVICLGYDQKSFEQKLKILFPKIKVVRLKPYKSDICKSSKLKNKLSKPNT